MKGKAMQLLCMGIAMMTNALATEDKLRDYPAPFYIHRATESKEPGIHRMRIDNRTLEIQLPEAETDEFFMPEEVRTNIKTEAYEKTLSKGKVRPFQCFYASWRESKRGLLALFSSDKNAGSIGMSVKVVPHTRVWIRDSKARIPVGTAGDVIEGKRPVDLDYFKLEDFIRAVCGERDSNPCRVEVINGRRWVRELTIPSEYMLKEYKWNNGYGETLSTPIDQHRILSIDLGLSRYYPMYAASDSAPDWMKEVNKNIEAVLRSIKVSPPDDGSPDPFLIDPEQKPGPTPIEFPAPRR